jgi:hypothetical protein
MSEKKEIPEAYYVRKPNGRYEHVGYCNCPDICTGLWLITSPAGRGGKRYENVFYRLADIPDCAEVQDMVKCMLLSEMITEEIVHYYDDNISRSPAEMGTAIGKKVYEKLQEDRKDIKKLDGYLED